MDRSVITEAAKGDIKAFKAVFDFYLPKMRPVALRYSRTVFEAEDILQESFVKIYHNLGLFKFEGSFEGWVRRIVVNTALNHHKKNNALYSFESVEEVDDCELGWEELADIEVAETSRILSIINELPEGYKMVFNLYVMEEYSHREIGEMLGISEGSSRSQYSKARKMIKKLLSRQRMDEKNNLIDKDGSK